jgi:hypothetical protein
MEVGELEGVDTRGGVVLPWAQSEWLASVIPGFASALSWPY